MNANPHETIYQRAHNHLQALQTQRTDIESQIAATQAEHDQARAAHQVSAEQFQVALSQLQGHENQWRTQNHYTMLAEGTDAHAESKDASDRLAEQVKDASSARDIALRQKNSDSTSEQELATRLAQLRTNLDQIDAELSQAHKVKRQAHAALGVARHAEALGDWQKRQSQIDTLKAQAAQLEQARNKALDTASKGLRDWGEHHQLLRSLRTKEDDVSRVLKAEIAYIEALIDARQTLPKDLNLPSLLVKPYLYGASWWDKLKISHDEIMGVNGLQGDAIALREHLAVMQHIAEEWEQHVNTQPAQG